MIQIALSSGVIEVPQDPDLAGVTEGQLIFNLTSKDAQYIYELNEINFYYAKANQEELLLADKHLAIALNLDLASCQVGVEQIEDYFEVCDHIQNIRLNIDKWLTIGKSLYEKRFKDELGPFSNSDENVAEAICRVVTDSIEYLDNDFQAHNLKQIEKRAIECGVIYEAVFSAILKWPKKFEKHSELFKSKSNRFSDISMIVSSNALISIAPESIDCVYNGLKVYFLESDHPDLLNLLAGRPINNRLNFNGNANKLVEAFRRLIYHHKVENTKEMIIKVLSENFSFGKEKKTMKPNTIKVTLNGRQRISAINTIKIDGIDFISPNHPIR